jgi:hypothetical protein
MEPLTWTCHVCGRERPDERISVYSRHVTLGGGVVAKENVRYCNDRPACAAGAIEKRWLQPAPEGEA